MVSMNVLVLAAAITAGGDDTLLLEFGAEWCEHCRVMAPAVQRLEDDGFRVRRINIDQYPRLVEQWNVGPIPCYILVQNGREVERVVGAASYDRLVRMFEKAGARGPGAAAAPHAMPPQSPPPVEVVRGQAPPDASFARRMADAAAKAVPRFGESPEPARGDFAPATARADFDPERAALDASVRLRIEEADGNSYGTGTIIDVHGDEALIVTCGHLFRESRGQSPIYVELMQPGAAGPVMGQLIAYDADERDIALVSIRPGLAVRPAPVAPHVQSIQPGATVFSLGCNHGGPISVMRSRITTVDRYVGQHNIEVAGEPVDGRSGGGLFNSQGELIGICNAADPGEQEGIYAGLKTIHWQLAEIGQTRIFQNAGSTGTPEVAESQPGPQQPEWRTQQPTGFAGLDERAAPPAAEAAPRPNLLAALESGAEVICVVRTPQQKDEVLVLDAESRALLAQLARSHRTGAVPDYTADQAGHDGLTVRGQRR